MNCHKNESLPVDQLCATKASEYEQGQQDEAPDPAGHLLTHELPVPGLEFNGSRQSTKIGRLLWQTLPQCGHQGYHAHVSGFSSGVWANNSWRQLVSRAPAVKRSLCRRCFLPLIPGVNTELHVEEGAQEAKTDAQAQSNGAVKTKKKRHRRQRKKPRSRKTGNTNQEESEEQIQESTEQVSFFLECSLCCGRRSFAANSQRDCWLEQPQSIVQVVSLPKEKDER